MIYSIEIGGQAGQGIKSVGLMFAKLAVRSGYHIYDSIEYPSLIRGGHNVMKINFSTSEVTAPREITNLLIALNTETINTHLAELRPDTEPSAILFEATAKTANIDIPQNVAKLAVPLSKFAEEAGSKDLYVNIVALGSATAYLGASLELLNKLITEEFKSKGPEVVAHNQKAALLGYNYVLENFRDYITTHLKPSNTADSLKPNMILTGCEAVALGAIAGGLQFSAIYPMSPISNILHVLAAHQQEYGYVYKQPEDEISALAMCIGAATAGARTLTATSGGGFCLMTEGYGLAGMIEAPVVIVDGMRGGPATGLPTWGGQGDLKFVLSAHQDDFPRIVLAAGDAKEAFELTMTALNLAEKYQTPVVLLLDKALCENDQSVEFLDYSSYTIDRGKVFSGVNADYKRYELTTDGISPRAYVGSGNFFVSNSDEHDEYGVSTEESDLRNKMMEKRMMKLETCAQNNMPDPEVFGPINADITLISWGTNKGSILQALKELANENSNAPTVNFIHVKWLNPLPAKQLTTLLTNAKHVINIEQTITAQFAGLIREKTRFQIKHNILKYDGRQIYPSEIIAKIHEVLKKGNK